jgi:hypothetical protein
LNTQHGQHQEQPIDKDAVKYWTVSCTQLNLPLLHICELMVSFSKLCKSIHEITYSTEAVSAPMAPNQPNLSIHSR